MHACMYCSCTFARFRTRDLLPDERTVMTLLRLKLNPEPGVLGERLPVVMVRDAPPSHVIADLTSPSPTTLYYLILLV